MTTVPFDTAGFVWHFQRSRSAIEAELGASLDAIHRWALERKHNPLVHTHLGL